jgi:anti-sigma B factor antagonist
MTTLTITERKINNVLILDLEGKIVLGNGCSEFHEAVRLLVERGEKRILLNMANISYVDSSGLGELVSSFTTFDKNAGVIKLLHLSEKVNQLMILTKLLTIFDVYSNETEAVESFTNQPIKMVAANV